MSELVLEVDMKPSNDKEIDIDVGWCIVLPIALAVFIIDLVSRVPHNLEKTFLIIVWFFLIWRCLWFVLVFSLYFIRRRYRWMSFPFSDCLYALGIIIGLYLLATAGKFDISFGDFNIQKLIIGTLLLLSIKLKE